MWWPLIGGFTVGFVVSPFVLGALRKWFFGADGGY